MAELLSCPFCGHDADHVHVYAGEEIVRCSNVKCLAAPMVGGETEAEAITNWNHRAHLSSTDSQAITRLQWLHSPASGSVDGWEWGIFKVKWGKHEGEHQIRHTFADFSDLDEAMASSGAATPSPAVTKGAIGAERTCNNGECGWHGTTDRMLGSIGPLCPECGETTEPDSLGAGIQSTAAQRDRFTTVYNAWALLKDERVSEAYEVLSKLLGHKTTPPPAGAQQAVALPTMPTTADRRLYCDENPSLGLESDRDWCDVNGEAVRWFIENHIAIRAALAAPAAAQGAAPSLPALACKHSDRSDCGLFGMGEAVSSFPLKRERPSREWYASKIQETLNEDFVIGAERFNSDQCDRPPEGWRCTRNKGHDGPCAATPAPEAAPTTALTQISDLLSSMFSGARAHVRGEDEEVVGYTVRNGALHKIVGILASYRPVIIPANLPKAHETITGLLCGTSEAAPSAKEGEWRFFNVYADTEVRNATDSKLLAVICAGPDKKRILQAIKGLTPAGGDR